jgi:transcriptional regulator with XRE-family HTH domain
MNYQDELSVKPLMPRRTEADPLAAQIGQRIQQLRKLQGLTQEKLAYEAGLKSKGHLSGIEKGLVFPTLPTLGLLAERFGVDLLDLLTFPDSSDRHRLIDQTRSLRSGTVKRLIRELSAQ